MSEIEKLAVAQFVEIFFVFFIGIITVFTRSSYWFIS
jgi:hypothetical protein